MSSAPIGGPVLETLADTELIDLLPVSEVEKYDDRYHELAAQQKEQLGAKRESFIRGNYKRVLDTLWLRHEPNMRNVLQGKVSKPGSTLCPPQQPCKEDFVAEAFTRAYQAFLAGTFRKKYDNFPGYVWTLVFRGALDERKHLKGRFKDDSRKSNNNGQKGGQSDDGKSSAPHDEIGPQKPILVSQPEGMPDPTGDELNLMALDVDIILDGYAKESEENVLSARVLRRRWVEEWTWEEVADELFPSAIDGRTLEQRTASARTFGKKDEQRVLPRLAPLRAPRGRKQGG